MVHIADIRAEYLRYLSEHDIPTNGPALESAVRGVTPGYTYFQGIDAARVDRNGLHITHSIQDTIDQFSPILAIETFIFDEIDEDEFYDYTGTLRVEVYMSNLPNN